MPPRFAYWTIILDGMPTSFRTKEREEILPLFNQLKAKNPSALLKWFSGGTLWDSPEQAREARERLKVRAFRETRAREERELAERPWSPGSSDPGSPKAQREVVNDPLAEFRRQHGRPADGSDDPSRNAGPSFPQRDDARPRRDRPWSPGASGPGSLKARPGGPRPDRRGKDWRPGGDHRDPADKYKLPPGEARKRWKERNLGPRGPKPPGASRDGGRGFSLDGPAKPAGDRPWSDKPRGPKPFGSKPAGDRPWSDRPRGPKPFGSKPGGDRPGGDRPWSDKPRGPKPFGSKPPGDRPWSGKPRAPRPFGGKPPGGRPRGAGRPPSGPRGKK
jgi:hypothetical protein